MKYDRHFDVSLFLNEYLVKRCFRCRWLFQCHREHLYRVCCRACEDMTNA